MILITFALPDESAPFLRKLADVRRTSQHQLCLEGTLGTRRIAVVHVGMGKAACERALQSSQVQDLQTNLLIAAGVAGALNPKIQVGETFHITNFSSAHHQVPLPPATLVTRHEVVDSAAEKQSLHQSSGADLLDMETEEIVNFAASRNLPMLAIRAVSDDAHHDFPVPSEVCFDIRRQRPRVAALLGHLALHPSKIRPFARFVGNVRLATGNLADNLNRVLNAIA